ncbi:hypothetical protein D5086_017124 [Populus alba]|uniref:Uncharacterized protein n=1 Tax=Populus alba TaxID=43335 RepID=A0ACC4BW32_POPAL
MRLIHFHLLILSVADMICLFYSGHGEYGTDSSTFFTMADENSKELSTRKSHDCKDVEFSSFEAEQERNS